MANIMRIGQKVLRHYKVVDLIATGGQAAVAKATSRRRGEYVAIRQLLSPVGHANHDQELARFKRAGTMTIGHPNVVDPIDFGHQHDEWYMITPFIEGGDLESFVAKHGSRLDPARAASILEKIAGGISAIHAAAAVHRDIKPANILIDAHDEPYIIDLGICREIGKDTVSSGDGLLGSPQWMAPEQIVEPAAVDHRADLHALGTVMYFMLTGSAPFTGNTPDQMLLNVCQQYPQPPSAMRGDIPPHLDQLCMHLLEKDPDARPQKADEVIAILSGQTTPPEVHHPGVQPPVVPASGVRGQDGGLGRVCPSCQRSVGDDYRYCIKCGADLNGSVTPQSRCLACGASVNGEAQCISCRRTFSSRDHRLKFKTGALTGVSFRVPEGIYVTGRTELSPRDGHLSRRHLHVACNNGTVQVQDARSANGTRINGQEADRPIQLQTGMELVLAGNTATFTSN